MAESQSFQQAMNRLSEIVSMLERNEIELEEAIKLFEEGLQLVNQCDSKLKGFEDSVAKLMNTYQEGEEHA